MKKVDRVKTKAVKTYCKIRSETFFGFLQLAVGHFKLKEIISSNHQRLHQIDLVGQDKVVLVDLGKELVDKLLESVVGGLPWSLRAGS